MASDNPQAPLLHMPLRFQAQVDFQGEEIGVKDALVPKSESGSESSGRPGVVHDALRGGAVGEHGWVHLQSVCLPVFLCSEDGTFQEQAGVSSQIQAGPRPKSETLTSLRSQEQSAGHVIHASDSLGRHSASPCVISLRASHMSLICPLLVAERPAPPRELLVPQAEVTARSLWLQWVPGSDGASPIRYFTVQLRELPRGQWQTYSSSISHEATACAIERYPEGQRDPPQPPPAH